MELAVITLATFASSTAMSILAFMAGPVRQETAHRRDAPPRCLQRAVQS
jgi:hypothetical protein